VLVIDEADMTLDMGFLEDVDVVASAMPKNLQILIFSATIPKKMGSFLKKYLTNPLVEKIPTENVVADTIENDLLATKSKDKNQVVLDLVNRQTPFLTLVFTNTKERAKELAEFLNTNGIKTAEIHGDIEARQRRKTMAEIKKLEYPVIVATDLAARGIDIDGISEVINEGIPDQSDFFIHRVGRTGRNGNKGLAITLYTPDQVGQVEQLEALGIRFDPKALKDSQLVNTKDHRARINRKPNQKKLDTTMIGLVQKKKKNVKPGYKKQIKSAIKRKGEQDRRVEERENRKAKSKR
jgi:ATP-dependent RNA helicase CshB